ncbi:MAG TPA: LamB/YcsF family protein, partial [Ottowia sp.]|nr:LamB/YcsF family protein [Ottowia sp.]
PGAVLHDADQVAERMLRWSESGTLTSISGRPVRLEAESICVHGDSPGAVAMARAVRARLSAAGVPLGAFIAAD